MVCIIYNFHQLLLHTWYRTQCRTVPSLRQVAALPLTFCTSRNLLFDCSLTFITVYQEDHNTIIWPSVRPSHHGNSSIDTADHSNSMAGPPVPLTPHNTSSTAPSTALTSKKSKKIFRNGFEQSAPKPLAYAPYQPVNRPMSGMGWVMKTKGEVQYTFCVNNIGKFGS